MANDAKGRDLVVLEVGQLGDWQDLIGSHAAPVSKAAGTTQASSVFPNKGKRFGYARFIVQCSKSHTVKVYGFVGASTNDPTAAVLLYTSSRSDNSATHGDGDHLVSIAGFDGCFCTVKNDDGAAAANIWTRGALLAGV